MENQSTTHKALKNVFYSIVSFGWPVFIAFFITPIIVYRLGIKNYGIYIFINTLISLAGLLDIGVSTALSKFIADKHGRGDGESLGKLFKTGNTILLGIGMLGFVAISCSIVIGLAAFPGGTNEYAIYIPAFICAGLIFFINSINTMYVILPTALQRFDISTKIGIFSLSFQQLTVLILVLMGKSINTIFFAQAILIFIFYFVNRTYASALLNKEERRAVHTYGWHKREALSCYKFGIVTFFNNIAGSSLTYLDRMILPLFLGPSNLTYYSLPGSITNKTPGFSSTLSSIVFPMTASFEGSGDKARIKTLYVRSMRLITVISTAITVTFIAFAYKMLQYWISVDVAEKATTVLIILALTNFILALTTPLSNFLLGMSKLKALTVTSLCTATLNAILLFILLPRWGLEGAAWAYLLALVPYMFLFYRIEKVYLMLAGRKKYYFKIVAQVLCSSVLTFSIDKLLLERFITNFAGVIMFSALSTGIFLGIHFMFDFFEKDDVRDITVFAKKAFTKLKFKTRAI